MFLKSKVSLHSKRLTRWIRQALLIFALLGMPVRGVAQEQAKTALEEWSRSLSTVIYAIAEDEENIWAGGGYLIRVEKKTGKMEYLSWPPPLIMAIVCHPTGSVLLGTSAGLYVYEKTGPNSYRRRANRLTDIPTSSLAVDMTGAIWNFHKRACQIS